MDFLAAVHSAVTDPLHLAAAEKWWDELRGTPERDSVRQNIENEELFELAPDTDKHIACFAEALNEVSHIPDPLDRARSAINSNLCIVCKGPSATDYDDPLVRIVSVRVAFTYFRDKRTGRSALIRAATGGDRTALRAWAQDFTDESVYYKYLRVKAKHRGQLLNVFWACLKDLVSLGTSPDANNVRAYLGLDPLPPNEPQLMIAASSGDVTPRMVPTGWDAFDNPHFLHMAPSPVPESGWTKNTATGGRGARELVTNPVEVLKTKVIRVM